MAALGDRILEAIRYRPLDDDVVAARLGSSGRQAVNQTARKLERGGLLRRWLGPDRKIVSELVRPGPIHYPPPRPHSQPPRTPVYSCQRTKSRSSVVIRTDKRKSRQGPSG